MVIEIRMTTSKSSEAFKKKQIFSDHKKQCDREKDFLKITKPYHLYKILKKSLYLLQHNRQTDRQDIHRIYQGNRIFIFLHFFLFSRQTEVQNGK